MITRNALYDFVESLIIASAHDSALHEAQSFRNLRSSVDEADKVVRVEVIDGQFCLSTDDKRKELNIRATIQCWVNPDGMEPTDLDAATDASFEMAREIFEAIAGDPQLESLVCDSDFQFFETGQANLGATVRGVTYIDGAINQAS